MADQPRPKKKLKLGLSKKKKKKKLEALNIGEAAPAAPVIAHRAGSLKKPSTTVPPTAHQQIHQQQNVRRLDAPPASPHLPAKIAHIDPLQSMNNTGTNADSNTKNNAAADAAADADADAEPTTTAATATATPSRHPTSAGNAHVSTSAPSSTSSSKRKPRKKLRRKRKVEASPPRDLLPTAGEGQDHAAVAAAAAAAAAGCTGAAAGLGTLGGAATHPESRAQYNPNPAAVAKAEVARRFLKAMAIKGKMEPLPMPRNYSSSSPPLSSPTTIMPVPALATALIFTANAMHSNSRRHEEKSIQSFLPTVQSLELTPSSTIHSAWAPARKNAFW